jgi:triosephosphate isomerase
VRAKAAAAQGCGLTAIICVGETLAERDAGRTLAVVQGQLAGSLPPTATAANTVIAYEPVWAIGTGRTPKPQEIAEVHAAIRATLGDAMAGAATVPILYGGSVKADNAAEILAIAEVGGALVGGASLNAADFWSICRSCR